MRLGPADGSAMAAAAAQINAASKPIVLLGLQTSQAELASGHQAFLQQSSIPYGATLQGSGRWVAPEHFVGRVGLFRNQPADRLLDAADCVITVGFDAIEYDPSLWNSGNQRPLVAIDVEPVAQDQAFLPTAELIGDLQATLAALGPHLNVSVDAAYRRSGDALAAELQATAAEGAVIHELQQVVTPETTIALDVGSNYIWMNRYFPAAYARQVLVSNGQQTLGVALPWAMAAYLCRPGTPVISVSGDGGFLFTATELQTATRIGSRFVHLIWNSGSYDMVAIQEQAHSGRTAGVELGTYDVVAFAETFGCKGYRISRADQLGPVLIDIPINYTQNQKLMQDVHQDFLH